MYVGESDDRWLASILRPGGPGRDLPSLPFFLARLLEISPGSRRLLSNGLYLFAPHFSSRSFRYRYARPTVPYVCSIGNLVTFFDHALLGYGEYTEYAHTYVSSLATSGTRGKSVKRISQDSRSHVC